MNYRHSYVSDKNNITQSLLETLNNIGRTGIKAGNESLGISRSYWSNLLSKLEIKFRS